MVAMETRTLMSNRIIIRNYFVYFLIDSISSLELSIFYLILILLFSYDLILIVKCFETDLKDKLPVSYLFSQKVTRQHSSHGQVRE